MKIDVEVARTRSGYLALKIKVGDTKIVLASVLFRFIIAWLLFSIVNGLATGSLLTRRIFLRRGATYLLYACWIFCIIFPWLWPVFTIYPCLWSLFFFLEIVVDEVYAFVHRFDSKPAIGGRRPGSRWELVAAVKSSNNGYNIRQFFPVTVCDFNRLDDPLWPHASTIYMVEIRRRSLAWRTITIWQASLLDGGQKKVHEFHQFFEWTDANAFGRRCNLCRCCVTGYQSNGVIFVSCRWFGENSLYVYDRRYQKSATYRLPRRQMWRKYPGYIRCLGQSVAGDGSVQGWRILWITASKESRPDVNGIGLRSHRASLGNETFELKDEARSRSHEEILFGNFQQWPVLRYVRTSGGLFGVIAEDKDTGDGPSMLYNPAARSYVHCSDRNQLLQLDQPFASYFNMPFIEENRKWDRSPVLLSNRECVDSFCSGKVYRAEIGVPTLKYQAAKALLRANLDLRKRMTAGQFRQLTGIDGMDGHFG